MLFLGATPPFLAILAEILNPISGESAANQTTGSFEELIIDRGQGKGQVDREIKLAGDVVGRAVDGAVEVAGIMPSWISVIAGIAGIAAELLLPITAAMITLLLALVSAVALIYFFSGVDYYELEQSSSCRICQFLRARSKSECISRSIVMANSIVIALALMASSLPEKEPANVTAKQPAHHQPAEAK